MKRYLLPLFALVLVSCGPSEKERIEIATITCNIISESRNMDGAMRIKEINSAREKLGEDPFLGKDDVIKDAVKFGLCEPLVLNSPDFETTLEATLEAYQRRLDSLAEVRRLERIREADERKRETEEFLAKLEAERNAERLKNDSVRKAKAEASRRRSIEAKKKVAEQQTQWRLKVAELVKDVPSPIVGELEWNQRSKTFSVKVPCEYFTGLSRTVTIYFKQGLGKVENESVTGSCYSNLLAQFNIELSPEQEKALYQNRANLEDIIERVTVSVIGVFKLKYLDANDSDSGQSEYFPQYYSHLNYGTTLADPFVYELQF